MQVPFDVNPDRLSCAACSLSSPSCGDAAGRHATTSPGSTDPHVRRGPWPKRHRDHVTFDRLAAMPPFELLLPWQFDQMLRGARVLRNTGTSCLFHAEARVEALYVVVKGNVVLRGPDDVVVDGVSGHGIVGVADLFNGRHIFRAEAKGGSLVVRIPRPDMLAAVEANGALAHAFLSLIAAGNRRLVTALMAQRCLTSVQRLAAFLLDQAAAAGAENSFVLDVPKKVVAGQLGMSTAHFARSLTRLASVGVERNGPHTIVLSDIAALRGLLDGELDVACEDGRIAQHKQRHSYAKFGRVTPPVSRRGEMARPANS